MATSVLLEGVDIKSQPLEGVHCNREYYTFISSLLCLKKDEEIILTISNVSHPLRVSDELKFGLFSGTMTGKQLSIKVEKRKICSKDLKYDKDSVLWEKTIVETYQSTSATSKTEVWMPENLKLDKDVFPSLERGVLWGERGNYLVVFSEEYDTTVPKHVQAWSRLVTTTHPSIRIVKGDVVSDVAHVSKDSPLVGSRLLAIDGDLHFLLRVEAKEYISDASIVVLCSKNGVRLRDDMVTTARFAVVANNVNQHYVRAYYRLGEENVIRMHSSNINQLGVKSMTLEEQCFELRSDDDNLNEDVALVTQKMFTKNPPLIRLLPKSLTLRMTHEPGDSPLECLLSKSVSYTNLSMLIVGSTRVPVRYVDYLSSDAGVIVGHGYKLETTLPTMYMFE